MGIIIPFPSGTRSVVDAPSDQARVISLAEHALELSLAKDARLEHVLDALRLLIAVCRERYGFVVMSQGLPSTPGNLGRSIIELAKALEKLESAMVVPRTVPIFCVYFDRPRLAWFEDGYGDATGLAVPFNADADQIAAFVRERVTRQPARERSRS